MYEFNLPTVYEYQARFDLLKCNMATARLITDLMLGERVVMDGKQRPGGSFDGSSSLDDLLEELKTNLSQSPFRRNNTYLRGPRSDASLLKLTGLSLITAVTVGLAVFAVFFCVRKLPAKPKAPAPITAAASAGNALTPRPAPEVAPPAAAPASPAPVPNKSANKVTPVLPKALEPHASAESPTVQTKPPVKVPEPKLAAIAVDKLIEKTAAKVPQDTKAKAKVPAEEKQLPPQAKPPDPPKKTTDSETREPERTAPPIRPQPVDPIAITAKETTPAEPLHVRPETLLFAQHQGQQKIDVSLGDAPVPSRDIKFNWHERVASNMFTTTKAPGAITVDLVPDKRELGTYELTVQVGGQEKKIPVEVAGLESVARETVNSSAGHETLDIPLAVSYVEGAILQVSTGGDPQRYYVWKVDDTVVLEGTGKDTLAYPLERVGAYKVNVIEKEGGRVRVSAEARTTVRAEPELVCDAGKNQLIELTAANEKYRHYEWRSEGQVISTEPQLKRQFAAAGQYCIECKMTGPVGSRERAFRRLVWRITVK